MQSITAEKVIDCLADIFCRHGYHSPSSPTIYLRTYIRTSFHFFSGPYKRASNDVTQALIKTCCKRKTEVRAY